MPFKQAIPRPSSTHEFVASTIKVEALDEMPVTSPPKKLMRFDSKLIPALHSVSD